MERLRQEFPRSTIRAFLWSGETSHTARAKAADSLAAFIRNGYSLNPEAHHFMIAHSHGGNVALNAIKRAGETRSISGLVTLGTPSGAHRSRPAG